MQGNGQITWSQTPASNWLRFMLVVKTASFCVVIPDSVQVFLLLIFLLSIMDCVIYGTVWELTFPVMLLIFKSNIFIMFKLIVLTWRNKILLYGYIVLIMMFSNVLKFQETFLD